MSMTAIALAAMLATSAPSASAPMPIPTGDDLKHRIELRDAQLFYGAFEKCDPTVFEKIMMPNFRMVHDKDGLFATSRDKMVNDSRRECAARRPGGSHEEYRNRREIVPGSRIIRPMGDWGALEEASHVFFEWNHKESRWEFVGGARYMNLWQWIPTEGHFRMLESLSYDHGQTLPYPPPPLADTPSAK